MPESGHVLSQPPYTSRPIRQLCFGQYQFPLAPYAFSWMTLDGTMATNW
jgi:hypothetical protein